MANVKAKAETANRDRMMEYVTIYVPPARPGEEQQLMLSINGDNKYVPRGRTVSLPRYAAEYLQHVLREEAKYEGLVAETHREDPKNKQYL